MVSSHGQITSYSVGPDDHEKFKRLPGQPRAFLTQELSDEEIMAIAVSRMDPRHGHLDALLDPK